jgi:hypothetical protein
MELSRDVEGLYEVLSAIWHVLILERYKYFLMIYAFLILLKSVSSGNKYLEVFLSGSLKDMCVI